MIIITSSPNTWKIGAELIKYYQHTEFSHVAIIKGDLIFQASHGYVNCVHIDNFLADNKIISFYEVPDDKVDMDFVYKQLGKPYGYKQIFEIAIRYLTGIKITIKTKVQQFICSQFVGGALGLPWVTELTTPYEIDNYLKSIGKE